MPKEVHELVDHHMSKCVKKFEETRPLLEKENRVQANIVDGDQMKRESEDASPIEAELRNLHVQAGKDCDGTWVYVCLEITILLLHLIYIKLIYCL